MKPFKSEQVQNIIFLVLVITAALGIYWFSNRPAAVVSAPLETPAPTDTPAPSARPTPGVPKDAFLSALEEGGLTVRASEGGCRLEIPASGVALALTLTVRGDTVQGFTAELPVTAPVEAKPGSAVEKALEERYPAAHAAECDAIRTALLAAGTAFRDSPMIPYATLLRWYDGAIDAMAKNGGYEDASDGCRFFANATLREGKPTLAFSILVTED